MCVCVYVCVCLSECVCVCVYARERECVCVCTRSCRVSGLIILIAISDNLDNESRTEANVKQL